MIVATFAELRGRWMQREGMLRWLFGESPTLVHLEYLALLERADVEAEMPAEVHRGRRLRDARKQARRVGHGMGQSVTR